MTPILELAYKKHNDWNNIVKSFGCNPSMSEDVVMEMYIQLDADVKKRFRPLLQIPDKPLLLL